MNSFFTPNDEGISGKTDSISIQNAIDKASREGLNMVVIPRFNNRTKKCIWSITETIFLPSDMTVILENCHLRMADGTICNMFCNSNARTPLGKTLQGRQHNIYIKGIGNAVIDGGIPNGLNERTSLTENYPHVSQNLTIYMHNVINFGIENITVTDQRWWSMAFMFASRGYIRRINFQLTRHEIDTYLPWRNQDGIDLRIGCNNIEISDIFGETGDDVIALTALAGKNLELPEVVENADRDIHDIAIHNVHGITNMCAIVRLLCNFGQKIYNISIRDIFDMSRPRCEGRPGSAVRIGDDVPRYYGSKKENKVKHGALFNISIENIYTRAFTAISVDATVKNLTARNIYVRDDGGFALSCGHFVNTGSMIYHASRADEMEQVKFFLDEKNTDYITTAENVLIENVYYSPSEPKSNSVFGFLNADLKNFKIRNVINDTALPLVSYLKNEYTKAEIE